VTVYQANVATLTPLSKEDKWMDGAVFNVPANTV